MLGKGIASFGGAVAAGRILQVVAALMLIKHLTPYQMGVVGLLTAVFVGAYSLTNAGLDRYLVHAEDKDINSDVVNNIWTLQLIRGFFVFVVCFALSIVIPMLTDFKDEISMQLMGVGAALLIHNVSNPHITRYEREGNFYKLAGCQGASIIVGSLAMIVLIQHYKSPWAYVVGQLVNTATYAALTFFFVTEKPAIGLDGVVIRKILRYCKYLLVISIVSVIAVQFENYYIAFVFGPETLGFYFTWARLVYMPRELIAQVGDKILFTKACVARRENFSLAKEHLVTLSLSIVCIVPLYVAIWCHGEWIISVVAGVEWIHYHWVGKFFVVISFIHLLALLFSPIVLANFPKISSILRSCEVGVLVLLMIWLGERFGIQGVLVASLITIFIAFLVRVVIVYRYVMLERWFWHASRLLAIAVVILGFMIAIEWFWSKSDATMTPENGLVLSYAISYMLIATVCVWVMRMNKRKMNP
jgi:O-antigen/teichoic acid export membrane protein